MPRPKPRLAPVTIAVVPPSVFVSVIPIQIRHAASIHRSVPMNTDRRLYLY
jgi:hypothetical protein